MYNRPRIALSLSLISVFGGGLAVTSLAPREARASVDVDRRYALENVGVLRSWDNVDGLFTDYVASAYRDFFARQSRFTMIDLAKGSDVLAKSKIPYPKLIEDAEILNQLARTARAQTVLRTKVLKEGPSYRFSLQWLHAPQMAVIASDTFTLGEPGDGKGFGLDQIRTAIQASLGRMIAKVPFAANVTGRDNGSITLNIGSGAGLAPGDTVVISTLDEVKIHPLLKEIVDWRLAPIGRAVIEQVEEAIAFARVTEEEPGRQVGRYQKVTQVFKAPKPAEPAVIVEKNETDKDFDKAPTLGYVMGALGLGGVSQSYGTGNSFDANGGFGFGARGEGQLWFTREWFGELGGGFGSAFVEDTLLFNFKIAAGYAFLGPGELFGPKAWVKIGYHANTFHMPLSQNVAATSLTSKSPFIGVGGEIPIRDRYGAILNLEYGVLSSASDGGGKAVNGASDVYFYVGGYYRLAPRLIVRAGVEFIANGANFANGASLTEKQINLAPALLFYF